MTTTAHPVAAATALLCTAGCGQPGETVVRIPLEDGSVYERTTLPWCAQCRRAELERVCRGAWAIINGKTE